MTPLHVDLGSRSYPIYIDSGIISNDSLYQEHIRGNNVLIVCDDNTARHYLPAMEALLSERLAGTAPRANPGLIVRAPMKIKLVPICERIM